MISLARTGSPERDPDPTDPAALQLLQMLALDQLEDHERWRALNCLLVQHEDRGQWTIRDGRAG
jgi:hypothetical protein